MTHEEAARESLRNRVLAAAGGAEVRFEELDCRGQPGRIIHYRVWVGPPGGAQLFGGRTLAEAAESAVRALTPGDPLPW